MINGIRRFSVLIIPKFSLKYGHFRVVVTAYDKKQAKKRGLKFFKEKYPFKRILVSVTQLQDY